MRNKNPLRGHGALSNRDSRYLRNTRTDEHAQPAADPDEEPPALPTVVTRETAKSAITFNDSPDVPFDRSVNFARGCQHGCIYCYARPTHAYLGLSPGLDFETRIVVKDNLAEVLRAELARPGYRPAPLALGANTDPYMPLEREHRMTRRILEVLAECRHPVMITTKGSLVERDMDLLAPMAERNLVRVMISVATLDGDLARRLEPRATAPRRRIETLRRLAAAGIPCGVIVAPVIPALTDPDIERVLEAARAAGAGAASYVFLRLPLEISELFAEWLDAHYPERAGHVLSLVRQSRGGRDNDATFGRRMEGTGVFADMIRQRFVLAARRLGFPAETPPLDCSLFRPPRTGPEQLDLFA
jgi:DNA repair photolyase